MSRAAAGERRLLLPVRRKLMGAAAAYLCGIFLAEYVIVPAAAAGIFCALSLVWAARRRMRRRSVFCCLLGFMLLLGNGLAGRELTLRDAPTPPGSALSGTVAAIEKPLRVYLQDVTLDGERAFARDVLVTLMTQEGEQAQKVCVGQRIGGTGRLFAQEEKHNPGGVDRRVQALADGYELSGYLLPGWTAEGNAAFSAREQFRRARAAILAHVENLFGERAQLFQGVMLGERIGLDADVISAMRLTGTAHILTVSGMHLSVIAMAMEGLLRRARLGRYAQFGVLSLFLILFTCLTGSAAGTVRACIMALMRALARLRGRRYEPLTALSAAALGMALVRPVWALDASFQFSFFVVLGIQLLGPGLSALVSRCAQKLPRLLRRGMQLAAVSASAQIAALPMQLLLYGYAPLLSLPMNLLCSLIVPVLLLGGWTSALVGAACMPLGRAMARLLSWPAVWFERLSVYAASLPVSIVRLPAPYAASVLLFVLLMLLVSCRIRLGPRRRMAAVGVCALLALSYAPRFCPAERYVQLDVGQGDAALLRCGRHAVLVDVGPADSYDMLRYLRHEGLTVDAVLLSHLDEDHAGALGVLLGSEVGIPVVVMARGAQMDEISPDVQEAMEALAAGDVPVLEARAGDRIEIQDFAFDVLSPDASLVGSNERSLVLHTQVQDVSLLLMGDLPAGAEPDNLPDCDILKVAHHGSGNATSGALLNRVQPGLALISVGANNSYGHPAQRVLDSLAAAGAQTLRTDECGCITVWLHEGAYRVQGYLQVERIHDTARGIY